MEIDLQSDFTLEELLGALKGQEREEGKGFHTRIEWQEILGVTHYRISKLLLLAKKKNKLLHAKHLREGVDGEMRPTRVYAFDVESTGEIET